VEAAETKVRVALMVLKSASLSVLATKDLALGYGIFVPGHRDSLAMTNSLDESWAFKPCFQIVFVYFRHKSSAEVVLKE